MFHYTSGEKKDSKLITVLRRHTADPYLSLGSALIFAGSAETAERLRGLIIESRPDEPPPLVLHEAMDDAERRLVWYYNQPRFDDFRLGRADMRH